MKKITAFLMALVLFIGVAVSAHMLTNHGLDTNNLKFGTWISTKKDLCYRAVASNIEEDTVLMMGSSEFYYGKDTPYHPTEMFRNLGMNVMCIGAAQNQTLSHTITLAAVAPQLKNKKVVLILSPTWFGPEGTEKSGFAARFSESMYEAMLENKNISEETKNKIIHRTEDLLSVSPGAQERAKLASKVILEGNASLKDKVSFLSNKWITQEKENINVGLLWKMAGGENNSEYVPAAEVKEPDWNGLAREADENMSKQMDNPFNMDDKLFKKKIVPEMKKRKNADKDRTLVPSPECDDLRLFLDVCRQNDIEAMLILLPINGWWYDYTGFPRENREKISPEIEKIAAEYGVKTSDMFDQCYTKGFLGDNVHPAGKGWVRINEEAYKFFKED